MGAIKFCRHCGKELKTDSLYCSYCGRPVDEKPKDDIETGAIWEEFHEEPVDIDIEKGATWEGDRNNGKIPSSNNKQNPGTTRPIEQISYEQIRFRDNWGINNTVFLASEGKGYNRVIWFLSEDKYTRLCNNIRSIKEEIHFNTILCESPQGPFFLLQIVNNKILKANIQIDPKIRFAYSLSSLFPSTNPHDVSFHNAPSCVEGYYLNVDHIITVNPIKIFHYTSKEEQVIPTALLIVIGAILWLIGVWIFVTSIDNDTISYILSLCLLGLIIMVCSLLGMKSTKIIEFKP